LATKTFISESNLLDKVNVDSLLSVLEDENVVQVERLSNVVILQEEDKLKDFIDKIKKDKGI
jgi:hypothetical protein